MNEIIYSKKSNNSSGLNKNDITYLCFVSFFTIIFYFGKNQMYIFLYYLPYVLIIISCFFVSLNKLNYLLLFLTPTYLYFSINTLPIINIVILIIVTRRIFINRFKLTTIIPLIFLLLLILLELFNTIYYTNSINFKFLKYFIIFGLSILNLVDINDSFSIRQAKLYLIVGTLLYSFAFLSINYNILFTDSFRVGGLGELDPNTYSFYNLLVSTIILNDIICGKSSYYNKLFLIFAAIIIYITGFLTLSKTYVIVSILILFIYFIINFNSFKKICLLLGFIFIIYLLFINIDYLNAIVVNMIYRFELGMLKGDLTTGRTYIYMHYLRHLSQDTRVLLFGYGLFGYRRFFTFSPHNSYIEILSAWGLIGVSIFLLIYYYSLRIMFNNIKFNLRLYQTVPVLVILIYMLTLTLIYQEVTPIYIMFILMIVKEEMINSQ